MGPSFPQGQWDNWESLCKLALQGRHARSALQAERAQGCCLGGAEHPHAPPPQLLSPGYCHAFLPVSPAKCCGRCLASGTGKQILLGKQWGSVPALGMQERVMTVTGGQHCCSTGDESGCSRWWPSVEGQTAVKWGLGRKSSQAERDVQAHGCLADVSGQS